VGLKVEAYSQLELADNEVDERVVEIDILLAFADRAPELVKGGVYRYATTFSFNVGGYRWYGNFRDALSRYICVPPHQAVLKAETREAERPLRPVFDLLNQPFCELLNFSDCVGTIGAGVCTKLARDFTEHEFSFRRRIETVTRLTLEGMRDDRGQCGNATDMSVTEIACDFAELYGNFKRAFQIGAESGAVKFT